MATSGSIFIFNLLVSFFHMEMSFCSLCGQKTVPGMYLLEIYVLG